MSEEKKDSKVIDLIRKQAEHTNSAQARRLLRNTGAIPRKFKKIVPKADALKE